MALLYHVGKNGLAHCASADIAMAHCEHFYLFFHKLDISSLADNTDCGFSQIQPAAIFQFYNRMQHISPVIFKYQGFGVVG